MISLMEAFFLEYYKNPFKKDIRINQNGASFSGIQSKSSDNSDSGWQGDRAFGSAGAEDEDNIPYLDPVESED